MKLYICCCGDRLYISVYAAVEVQHRNCEIGPKQTGERSGHAGQSPLTVDADTRVPHSAWVMSSTRRTLTPARYTSISASSCWISSADLKEFGCSNHLVVLVAQDLSGFR